jgi:polyphosphate kinase
VGRFLEHAQVAAFYQGGRWALYLTSADLMPRNFQNRFELLFPVLDKEGRLIRNPSEAFPQVKAHA